MKQQEPTFKLWCVFWFAAGIAITLIAQLFVSSRTKDPVALAANDDAPAAIASSPSMDPPWGELEVLPIPLANSDELFTDRGERLRPPQWIFDNHDDAALEALVRSCELTEAQRAMLLDRAHWRPATNGWTITPPDELVIEMSSAARAQLYSVLGHNPANYVQRYPFRMDLDGFDSRFAASGLTPESLAVVQRLTYTNSGYLCLTDLHALSGVLTASDFDRVIDALYHIPACRLRLRVTPESDIAALVRYWGKGGREKFIRPLLESLSRVPGGTSVSVSMLLPPTARLRLYTYPGSWSDEPETMREDCFWTSLNFFRDPPDDRFFDAAHNRAVLLSEYELVRGRPVYGDLIVLGDAAGNALHMCVYLADEFVFTKNGMNHLQPWVIMKIPDMMTYFPSEEPLRLVCFRAKERGETSQGASAASASNLPERAQSRQPAPARRP